MIKVGLVGSGFMGRMHATVYDLLPNATLVAVADDHSPGGAALAAKYGARAYGSLEAMIAAEKLDAIDICLPTFLHADAAVKAAEAGMHVLCEKPMALTLDDADRMILAARSHDVEMMIGHCIRFWPEYAALYDLHQSGRLGALRSLSMTRVSPLPTWSIDGWLMDETLSKAAALDLHIHDTDFVVHLLGRPDYVNACATNDEHGLSHIFSLLTFGSTTVSIDGGWDLPSSFPFKMAFRAVYEKGAVVFDGCPLTVHGNGQDPYTPPMPVMAASGADGGNVSDLGGYYREIAYFVDCLDKGEPVIEAGPESSRLSLAVALIEIEQARMNLPPREGSQPC